MDSFTLKVPGGAHKKRKRKGRGIGSGKGCTAGRGTKGQNSRSGGGVRPGFEGGQMPLYRRIARRGFSNYLFKKRYEVINIDDLDKFKSDELVSKQTLVNKGIIKNKKIKVKLLARGELGKKLKVELYKISASAKKKIKGAGGEYKELLASIHKQKVEKHGK